jgi:ribosome recycling factor
VKVAQKNSEQARIAVRHVRRDGMEDLKKADKAHAVSEDEIRTLSDKVQKLTDEKITEIDAVLSHKENEITQV